MKSAVLQACAIMAVIALIPTHQNVHAATMPSIINDKMVALEKETDVKSQPLSLLAKFPDAGPAMARYVAQVVAKQPSMFDAILSIVNDTSPEQASAIGAGLVRAVRMLGTKQAAAARTISERVQLSDNIWLKTTYQSLGPNYRYNKSFAALPNLPPRQFADMGSEGTNIGNEWKVGPVENDTYTARNPHDEHQPVVSKNCKGYTINYSGETCRGMIVALVVSDATDNGAVSTSPTM